MNEANLKMWPFEVEGESYSLALITYQDIEIPLLVRFHSSHIARIYLSRKSISQLKDVGIIRPELFLLDLVFYHLNLDKSDPRWQWDWESMTISWNENAIFTKLDL